MALFRVENTLYTVASELPATRLLVSVPRDEHATPQALNDDLVAAVTLGEIVGASAALNAVFQTHLQKENDILLPVLASGGVHLAVRRVGADGLEGPYRPSLTRQEGTRPVTLPGGPRRPAFGECAGPAGRTRV
ncbi:hypothetical protein [Streptosporangium saharense]|uniref:hypothetical protein n=1 Tax=Streptosporangium saharense TaxID=1706840 RepID=UPI003431D105